MDGKVSTQSYIVLRQHDGLCPLLKDEDESFPILQVSITGLKSLPFLIRCRTLFSNVLFRLPLSTLLLSFEGSLL
ncbi:hypothetical protein BLOT_014840 [Blomia tropicalis]|nr:hypothetical protein BLOT_014840 [Blomia tropicalis]